jgi:hypothetical protein
VRSSGNPFLAALYESVHTAIVSYEFNNWIQTESVPAWLRNSDPEEQMALHEPITEAQTGPPVGAELVTLRGLAPRQQTQGHGCW